MLDHNGYYEECFNDSTGSKVPFDRSFQCEDARIEFVLTVWNEAVYESVASRVNGNVYGAGQVGTVGTALGTESSQFVNGVIQPATQGTRAGGSIRLLINCPYAGQGAYVTEPICYNYPNAFLVDTTTIDSSSRFKKVKCTFQALPQWNWPTYAYVLFNQSRAGIPGTN
jgi:hypothetical protein